MANTLVETQAENLAGPHDDVEAAPLFSKEVQHLLRPVASLKLTVVLFAMAIFIVLAGTLAQVNKDIWEVIDQYFRIDFTRMSLARPVDLFTALFARIDLQIFFPPSFFPSKPSVPGAFPFPKGWLIGIVMTINLLAAHLIRFKIQASAGRLWAGLATIFAGCMVTYLVVISGSNKEGFQHATAFEWSTLWQWFKFGLIGVWLAVCYGWARLLQQPDTERWILILTGITAAALGVLSGWLLIQGNDAQLGDSSMRILWQLIKGAFAGLVLLVGCVMVFKKRAGIVLMHAGVLLMMAGEVLVGVGAVEGMMNIHEGETVNFVQDLREIELAFVDSSDPEEDDVVVIPQSILLAGEVIKHDELPCDMEVVTFFKNSTLRPLKADEVNPATAGHGLHRIAEAVRPGAGTDTGGQVDLASAYVKLLEKRSAEPLGTYLFSQLLLEDKITVGGKFYDVSLRFKRTYKPYSLRLIDVRKDDYLGTNTPRNYSSDVRLVDESRNVDREIHIWMNNPLRFAGETFYQSSYNFDPQTGTELTGLQVVTNAGWMIPYVACMIVGVAMMFHFSVTLLRFLNRRSAAPPTVATTPVAELKNTTFKKIPSVKSRKVHTHVAPMLDAGPSTEGGSALVVVPVLVVLITGGWLLSKARAPKTPDTEMQLYEFGKLPVVYEGRAKPMDTLARNSLRVISNVETFVDSNGETQPAIRWLLDMMARPEVADQHRVFRIDNLEVLETLGLKRRKGLPVKRMGFTRYPQKLRYAMEEFRPKAVEFNEQVDLARKLPAADLSVYQRKILELDRRVRAYTLLQASFRALPFPSPPTEEEFRRDRKAADEKIAEIRSMLQNAVRADRMLSSMQPPLAVPVANPDESSEQRTWLPFATAWTQAYVDRIQGQKPNEATISLAMIVDAYVQDDVKDFNREVAAYHASLKADPPEKLNPEKTDFEAYFNHVQLFTRSSALYLSAFVLAWVGWLAWTRPLHRASFWLIAFTFVAHTLALVARIYISGRPPVTNLYSSAVFIGWGTVLLGIILEMVYRKGVGNVIAGISGFATLLIAHLLTTAVPTFRGDTFTVMQAVLDTQFWLATHVVCITLGYATTYVAGLLGILYIVLGVFSPALKPKMDRDLIRMIYGTICFSLFFSFVGTVLGGLWADDSWGRFWGWDPKENGALIIVLWNALVLHARWDGMARKQGLAVLAVAGIIATSWSWFGVNELGVGLHSYGFTEGVLPTLGFFGVLLPMMFMAAGSLPQGMWWSYRERVQQTEA